MKRRVRESSRPLEYLGGETNHTYGPLSFGWTYLDFLLEGFPRSMPPWKRLTTAKLSRRLRTPLDKVNIRE